MRPRYAAQVFGDDALIVAPMKFISVYNKTLRECGAEISQGKHALSSTRGVYLEKLVVREGKK